MSSSGTTEGFINPSAFAAFVLLNKFPVLRKSAIEAGESPEVILVPRSGGNIQWVLRFC